MSDLTSYQEAAYLPEGPRPGSDLDMFRSGVILELDREGNRVLVSYNDGTGVWLSALHNMYTVGRTCWVFCNPLRGGRAEMVMSQIGGSSLSNNAVATLVSIVGLSAVVLFEGEEYTVGVIPNTYTAGAPVYVSRNPSRLGAPELLIGPCDVPPVDPTPPPVPVPGGGGATVQMRATIGPTGSGTWRSSRSAWDRWNTGQFGGASDLYQGSGYNSGPLKGLATYGDQLVNLGAISIDAVGVSLIHNGGSGMAGPPVLQGSSHGTRPGGAPASAGETFGADVPASVREGMRVGSVKGLALVGGGYYGVRGTSHPAGMVLSVLYTRSA